MRRRSCAIAALMAIATVRIVATYPVFSQTFDEPIHLGAGMQWLDRGIYTYTEHPPLARVAVALGPYLDGQRSRGNALALDDGNAILYENGRYSRTLALARAGILPFFLGAALVVASWSGELFGPIPSILSVGCFTMLPPILGHAGLATTDMALAATFVALLLTLTRFLDRPSVARATLLGLAAAAAVLSKFSALPFFAASAPVVLGAWWLSSDARPVESSRFPRRAVLAVAVATLTVWAGYRFSYRMVDGIPHFAPAFAGGIRTVARHNRSGHASYLLGEVRAGSWWSFFPMVLMVKTPIAFALLAATGTFEAVRRARIHGDYRPLVPPVAAGAVLAVAMCSNINLGVRHVLPVYVLLSIVAGIGVVTLWTLRTGTVGGRFAALALLAWLVVGSVAAHPDYLAAFNELAGAHPERILVGSDLDWGQDLLRLSEAARTLQIPSLALAYNGTADISQHGLPNPSRLRPGMRPVGWIAISETLLQRGPARWRDGAWAVDQNAFRWLDVYEPVARVGRSIRLYHLSAPSTG